MSDTVSSPSHGRKGIRRLGAIAHKEFRDGLRSTTVRIIFAVLIASTLLIYWAFGRTGDATVMSAVGFLGLPFQLLIPVAAISLGTTAISGEREAGSLKLLLGLPPSRTEVVVGKLIGLLGVLLVGIVGTFLIATILGIVVFGTVGIGPLVGVATAAALLGSAFLGLSIGLSATISTAKRSMAAGFGAFLGLMFFWEPIVAGSYYLVEGSLPKERIPMWLLAIERINPIEAYAIVANMLGDVGVTPLQISIGLIGEPSTATDGAGLSVPFILTEPLGITVLCGWLVVPLALGMRRFEKSDLT